VFSGTSLQAQTDCKAVAARLKEMISKVPSHVLTAVEDTLVASPECVCEIVKTAIEASKADADKVRRIVYVAVTTAPESAPAIAECAVAAAPECADSVRTAFAEAFEDGRGDRKTAPSKKAAQIAKTEKKTPKPAPASKSKPAAAPQKAAQSQPTTGQYAYADDKGYGGGGKAVFADGGKTVVWESGKQVVEPFSGKQVIDPAHGGETLVAGPYPPEPGVPGMDGEGPVEPPLPEERSPYAYAGQTNAPGYSSSSLYGGTAIDLSGIYLIPPVASAAPLTIEEPEEERVTASGPGRRSPLSGRRPIVRPPTMSPTGP
jgi:hypothetical protein